MKNECSVIRDLLPLYLEGIEDIIESLGLTLEYQYIRKNGRILGETVFDDDYIPIYIT